MLEGDRALKHVVQLVRGRSHAEQGAQLVHKALGGG